VADKYSPRPSAANILSLILILYYHLLLGLRSDLLHLTFRAKSVCAFFLLSPAKYCYRWSWGSNPDLWTEYILGFNFYFILFFLIWLGVNVV